MDAKTTNEGQLASIQLGMRCVALVPLQVVYSCLETWRVAAVRDAHRVGDLLACLFILLVRGLALVFLIEKSSHEPPASRASACAGRQLNCSASKPLAG